jgi:hypothetical protein
LDPPKLRLVSGYQPDWPTCPKVHSTGETRGGFEPALSLSRLFLQQKLQKFETFYTWDLKSVIRLCAFVRIHNLIGIHQNNNTNTQSLLFTKKFFQIYPGF